jgi:mannose-6-phosphate isomerase
MADLKDTRPWGQYIVLEDAHDHKVKRIDVLAGKRLSLQNHKKRDEHWFVISGSGVVTLDEKLIKVHEGVSVDIPRGAKHRIQNTGGSVLTFIEVQTGDYFGEDDIERFDDDFGRA